jgi:hypothetical protein
MSLSSLASQALRDDEAATPAPWCIDSVGEKNNAYIIGVAFAANDVDCKSPLSGWLPPLPEDEDEHFYCDEQVCELENAANATLIANARTREPILARAVQSYERVVEAARKVRASPATNMLTHYKVSPADMLALDRALAAHDAEMKALGEGMK